MSTVVITGANRGIGLALVKEYLAAGDTVIATARNVDAASELSATGAELHSLEVTDAASVAAFKAALGSRPIDILINNAGVGSRTGLGQVNYDEFQHALAVNAIAPVRVTEALMENLAASEKKLAVTITSQLGSIAQASGGWGLIYKTSKAAVNMAMRTAAESLAEHGIVTLVLHPGHVETDMGGKGAPVKPADSAAGLKKTIETAGPSKELRFLDWRGETLPW